MHVKKTCQALYYVTDLEYCIAILSYCKGFGQKEYPSYTNNDYNLFL